MKPRERAHLPTTSRSVLMRSARDRLLHARAFAALPFLDAGGIALLQDGAFADRAEEVSRDLVPSLLEEQSALPYLAMHSQSYATYVGLANTDTREVLFGLIRARIESVDETSRASLGDLLASAIWAQTLSQ